MLLWTGGEEQIVPLPSDHQFIGANLARQYAATLDDDHCVLLVSGAIGSSGFRTTSSETPPDGYVTSTGTWNRHLGDPSDNLRRDVTLNLAAQVGARELLSDHVELAWAVWSQREGDALRMTKLEYADASTI